MSRAKFLAVSLPPERIGCRLPIMTAAIFQLGVFQRSMFRASAETSLKTWCSDPLTVFVGCDMKSRVASATQTPRLRRETLDARVGLIGRETDLETFYSPAAVSKRRNSKAADTDNTFPWRCRGSDQPIALLHRDQWPSDAVPEGKQSIRMKR